MAENQEIRTIEWLYDSGRIDRDSYLSRLEKLRLNALAGWNAPIYYEICNTLGVDPEDKDLYSQAEAEQTCRKTQKTAVNPENAGNAKTIDSFVLAADRQRINADDFKIQSDSKKEVLRANFRRFRTGECQDLNKYDDLQVGSIFNKLYKHYSEKPRPNNH